MILIEHESPNLEIQLWKRSYVFPMTHSHQMGRLQKKKEVQRLGHQGLFAKSEKRLMGSNCLWQVPGNFPWLLFFCVGIYQLVKRGPHTQQYYHSFQLDALHYAQCSFGLKYQKFVLVKVSLFINRVLFCCDSRNLKKTVTVISNFMSHNKNNSRLINRDTYKSSRFDNQC